MKFSRARLFKPCSKSFCSLYAVTEIQRIWCEYNLEDRTHFNAPVTSVKRVSGGGGGEESRDRSKWLINDGQDGQFDAVIVTIGTCGEPNMVQFPGMPGYKPKEEKQSQEKPQDENEGIAGQDAASDGSTKPKSTNSVWSQPRDSDDRSAIGRDQRAKKAQGFPKPGELYRESGDESPKESPTQDEPTDNSISLPDNIGTVHGATTTLAGGEGAWGTVEEPTWQLGQDQATKREQGFLRPDEAYDVGPDVQKDTLRAKDVKHQQNEDLNTNEKTSRGQEPADGEEKDIFQKPILHSSQLTSSGLDFKGKRVVVLGGGASAVESVETALADGASSTVMVVRDDKVGYPPQLT